MDIVKYLVFFCLIHEIYPKAYDVVFQKFEVMPETDPEFVDFATLRVVKKSRTEVQLSGTFITYKKLTNIGILSLMAYRVTSVGPVNVFFSSGGFCDQVRKYERTYLDGVAHSNLPRDYCPFPAGNYTIEDLSISTDKLPITVPLGQYKMMFTYALNNKIIFGFSKSVDIIAPDNNLDKNNN